MHNPAGSAKWSAPELLGRYSDKGVKLTLAVCGIMKLGRDLALLIVE